MKSWKRWVIIAVVAPVMIMLLTGCASWDRAVQDMKSDLNNGVQRTIRVYTANGDLMAEYNGKIDLEVNQGGYVKFDFNGKRYIYYNCFVETIADISE